MKQYVAILVIATMMFSLSAGIAAAQADDDCADVAGNGYQLCGAFRAYWEGNDGAALLGAPLSAEFSELQYATSADYQVQYFEYQRLEQHSDHTGTAYELLLGRLGDEVLQAQGRTWHAFPKSGPSEPHYVEATGFAIAPEFIDFWSQRGLDLGDAGISFRESLALFGYPISQAQLETSGSGETVVTQWFERARFETHGADIVLGALGAELLAVPGVTDPVLASTLAQVQRTTAHYHAIEVAQSTGYDLIDGLDHCFNNPGVGAMGIHYINGDLLDTTLSPLEPEAMVYQHGAQGELSLGAVEWIVPADAWDAEGQNGPPEVMGHHLHLNEELGVYALHAWIFLENPAGALEDWNPTVSCP